MIVFSGERAVQRVLRAEGGELVLGRLRFGEVDVVDGRVSRNHASCRWEHGLWVVRDLGSRNGTNVDARPCAAETRAEANAVVRVGDTVVLLVPDVVPFEEREVTKNDGIIVGASLGAVLDDVQRAAAGTVLHVTGPSGSGKELAARAFHRVGPNPTGPFVAINCAAIPSGVAERVLFGARKGAFSGAHADAPGHVQNVRALIAEVTAATSSSTVGDDRRVRATALSPAAGMELGAAGKRSGDAAEPARPARNSRSGFRGESSSSQRSSGTEAAWRRPRASSTCTETSFAAG